MKLKNAAKYFDWDSTYDAYTGILLFKGSSAGMTQQVLMAASSAVE